MKPIIIAASLMIILLASSSMFTFNGNTVNSQNASRNGSANSIALNFNFSSPRIVETSGYCSINISNLSNYGDPGEPVLPFKLAKILIPQNEEVRDIRVKADDEMTLKGNLPVEYGKTILPTLSDARVADHADQAIYNSQNPFPGESWSFISLQSMKGYEILLLKLFPVQYVPKAGDIVCFQRMTVTIDLTRGGKTSQFFRNNPEDRSVVQESVDNPILAETYTQTVGINKQIGLTSTNSYEYVIITSSALNSSFQPLVNWKNGRGVTTRTVLIEDIIKDSRYNSNGVFGDGTGSPYFNDTQARIRNFIKDAYLNWGTQYVLLGGDDGIIPARGVYDYAGNYTDYNIPCDMYYAGLDGSWDKDNDTLFGEAVYHWTGPENATAGEEADFFAEVYVGRAPVNNALQTANFVSKTIAYEQASQAGADYLSNLLAVGEMLDDVTQGGNGEDFVADLIPQYSLERLYDRDGTFSKAAVINELNSGVNIVSHDGHSNYRQVMGLTSTDVDNLINTKFFMVYSIGCFSAAFDTAVSGTTGAIAERFVTSQRGAFAYIGNSRYGWYCPASTDGPGDRYSRSFVSVLNDGTRNLGKALQLSKQEEPILDRWTCFTLNLLGDPETQIVTSVKTPTARFETKKNLLSPPHVGGTIDLNGTAAKSTALGSTFNNFTIEYGAGTDPASWTTMGITLTGYGRTEISDGKLGTWNATSIADGTYTLRLSVYGNNRVSRDKWTVSVTRNAGPVYIEADGYVNPTSAPIQQIGNVYTLTGDIVSDSDGIIIEKDGVILNGASHLVQGNGQGVGIALFGRSRVSVQNISVISHLYGILMEDSFSNVVFATHMNYNQFGFWLLNSSANEIIGNEAANNYFGLSLMSHSGGNLIKGNTIRENVGMYAAGLYVYESSGNVIYHNSFLNNMIQKKSQVYDAAWDCADPGLIDPSINIWDNGYPSGGNYWSDHDNTDHFKGVFQNETGSDEIADMPYVIDPDLAAPLGNKDNYPLQSTSFQDVAVVKVKTSKTVVGTGYSVTISIWVDNEGSYTESFNVTVSATRLVSGTIGVFNHVTLSSRTATTLDLSWNTTEWALGNYTISALISPAFGQNSLAGLSNGTVFLSIVGDTTGPAGWPDGKVDMRDTSNVARLFGTTYQSPAYDSNCDIFYDLRIDMRDVGIVAKNFGS